MMLIENKYNIGQEVYLKTDIEQKKRIVRQINISAYGLQYELVCGASFSWHFELEISAEKNLVEKLNN